MHYLQVQVTLQSLGRGGVNWANVVAAPAPLIPAIFVPRRRGRGRRVYAEVSMVEVEGRCYKSVEMSPGAVLSVASPREVAGLHLEI